MPYILIEKKNKKIVGYKLWKLKFGHHLQIKLEEARGILENFSRFL